MSSPIIEATKPSKRSLSSVSTTNEQDRVEMTDPLEYNEMMDPLDYDEMMDPLDHHLKISTRGSRSSIEDRVDSVVEIISDQPLATPDIIDWKQYLIERKIDFKYRFFNVKIHINMGHEISHKDFYFIKILGRGAFAKVMLIQKKDTGKYFAAKILFKENLVSHNQIQQSLNERNILLGVRFPFTVHLEFFFQDNVYLYFVLPLVECGEIFLYLRKKGKFDEFVSKFYAAQVLLALEYLHFLGILYRDLKPENILLDRYGYIKLTDFGFCKRVKDRTYTLCGTPEYIAPEILRSHGYNRAVDYWSFGVLLYELNAGVTPFYAKEQFKTFEKIVFGMYRIPPFFSASLRDIVTHLLEPDLTRRYGNLKRGIDDIKDHRWFRNIPWIALINKGIRPPYEPTFVGPHKPEFFENYADESLMRSSEDPYGDKFADF